MIEFEPRKHFAKDDREQFDELAGKYEYDSVDFFPTRHSAEIEALEDIERWRKNAIQKKVRESKKTSIRTVEDQ